MSILRDQFRLDFTEQEKIISVLPPGTIPEKVLNILPECTFSYSGNPQEGDILVYRSGNWVTEKPSIIGDKQGFSEKLPIKVTVGPNPPANPSLYDLWLDTNG